MSISSEELERRFAELVGLERDRRAEALRQLQADSPELARKLAMLLDAHDATRDPLAGLHEEAVRRFAAFAPDALIGRKLGDWELMRLLGQGGMGVVYQARSERDGIEQVAAVKLLAAPMFNQRATDRFVQEARALARLDHPGICRLRDWGHSSEGWPYLVLDLVQGEPLPADGGTRTLRERLAILIRVADAVAAAHRQLVVHLDLKPGNVLMTSERGPVLLDFGVSRMLNDEPDQGSTLTRWLTPRYASPEQLRGEQATVATDVYALGVMLYEQATGRVPFRLEGLSVVEALQQIEQGATPPGKVMTSLPRDLDAICARAMHPDPRRRYVSADALAEDLRALLERRPVSARPDSLGYRWSRMLARHPIALPGGFLAVAAVASLAILLAFQAHDLKLQRDRAQAAAHRAQAATDLLLGAIKSVDPMVGDAKMPLSDYLDRIADRLNHSEEKSAAVYAQALIQLAGVRSSQGRFKSAIDLYRHAGELLQRPHIDDDPSHVRMLRHKVDVGLIEALRSSGQAGQALQLAQRLMAKPDGADDWGYALAAAHAELAQMQLDKAESYLKRAIAHIPPDKPTVRSRAYQDMGFIASTRGHGSEAMDWLKKAGALLHDEPEARALRASQLDDLAWYESQAGQYQDAEKHIQQALDMRIGLYGKFHHSVLKSLDDQIMIYTDAGDYDKAIAAAKQGLLINARLNGSDSRNAERLYSAMGIAYQRADQPEKARDMHLKALALAQKMSTRPNLTTANDELNLSAAIADMGNCKEALVHALRGYRLYMDLLHGKPSRQSTFAASNIADCQRRLGNGQESLRWSLTAYKQGKQVLGAQDWQLAVIRNGYAQSLLATGRVAKAEIEAEAVRACFSAAGKAARPASVKSNYALLARIYRREGKTALAGKYAALAK